MEDLSQGDAAVKVQELQHVVKLIKTSAQANHGAVVSNDDVQGVATMHALDDAMNDTSCRLLAWVKGAAAAAVVHDGEHQRRVIPPVLLANCCRYMEALATAYPGRFSADCQSLLRPVASLLLAVMENRAAAAAGTATPRSDASGQGVRSNGAESPATTDEDFIEISALEERKALELWVDMFGVCLLPFCYSGSDNGGSSETANGDHHRAEDSDNATRVGAGAGTPAGTQQNDDPFDSDSDSEEEEEDSRGDEERSSDGFSDYGKTRSRQVAGWWMRRAEGTPSELLECPLDVQPGGRDERLPCRLAAFLSVQAKAAAASSRPESVSSLTTVLVLLVAFTAVNNGDAAAALSSKIPQSRGGVGGDVPSESYLCVAEEAFTCLMCLSETAPESSAQAECVKVALESLKDWVQATRLPCLEPRVPALLSVLEGVPSRLKLLLTRSKSGGPKAYSTARNFCRDALAAAVLCSRKLLVRAGAVAMMDDPKWFLETFVVKMASPLLLGDAVVALRAASASRASPVSGGESELTSNDEGCLAVDKTLREIILTGAVERVTKALGSIHRYSAPAAKEVLKATSWLIKAAGCEVLPHRHSLGMALVACANHEGRSSGGGVGLEEKTRLCLRALRRLAAATESAGSGDEAVAGVDATPASLDNGGPDVSAVNDRSFAEAALNFVCGIVEKEWVGKRAGGCKGNENSASNTAEESVIMLVDAHVTLAAIVRSRTLRVPGIDPAGDWPPLAKRLAKLAWAVTFRVRKASEAVETSMALADDDVMLLCQGLEVLGALAECSSTFFEGSTKLVFFAGELSPILTTLRGCHDKNTMHPVVYDACLWVEAIR